MNNSLIIVKKELKDTLKNLSVLIQFVLFPVFTLIFENVIQVPDMQELFFTKLFSSMYIGMAPIVSVASIIAEEKEKNTLRVLLMANVKSWQYLLGVGIYVWMLCMFGSCVMATTLSSEDVPRYLIIMGIGVAISVVLGSCIGILAKNQMSATSITVPVMLILAFAPMLSMFNNTIKKFSTYLYTQQLNIILDDMSLIDISAKTCVILLINIVLFIMIFICSFSKKGLE